jgi:endonuclease/exonuclease/phosphatase family metal-dependent hydrolase
LAARIRRAAALACVLIAAVPASGQLRVVTYNVAQLNGNLNALEDVFAAMHADDVNGYAVPISVIVLQEVQSGDQTQLASRLNASAPSGVSYTTATFTVLGNENNAAGAQAMFYNASRVVEDVSAHADIFTGASRYADRWKLDLVGYDAPDASFYIYSMHLKAGTDSPEEREQGAAAVLADAETLPAGAHIIYAGDMNVYSNSEPAYTLFTTPDVASAIDPLGTGSWAGSGNAIKHTQSPCNSGCPLVGGGMDDRFDLMLPTASFHDDDGLAIIDATYRALGNDGQHYNQSINSGSNSYYPGDLARSNALADDLFNASDHIPVVADFQVPAVMVAIMDPSFGRVIQGGAADVIVFLGNNAVATVPEGADELNYIAQGSGDLSGLATGAVPALAGLTPLPFAIDTSATGAVSGTVGVTSTSEATQDNLVVLPASGTVVRPANPSFESASDVDDRTVQLGFDADTGVQPIDVEVHNFGFDSLQALLDVDAVTGAVAPFEFAGTLATDIGAAPATLQFTIDTDGLADGTYNASIQIDTSDEDLPGETAHGLSLTLEVEIGSAILCPADCADGGDGSVDVVDLLALLAGWGQVGACDTSPAGGDGLVDIQDLLELLATWGPCE